MFILYNILLVLLTIVLSPVLLFKIVTGAKYRGGISQKLGRVRKRVKRVIGTSRPIWVHAVSVGEVMAAHPLIRELKKKYPGHKADPLHGHRHRQLYGHPARSRSGCRFFLSL